MTSEGHQGHHLADGGGGLHAELGERHHLHRSRRRRGDGLDVELRREQLVAERHVERRRRRDVASAGERRDDHLRRLTRPRTRPPRTRAATCPTPPTTRAARRPSPTATVTPYAHADARRRPRRRSRRPRRPTSASPSGGSGGAPAPRAAPRRREARRARRHFVQLVERQRRRHAPGPAGRRDAGDAAAAALRLRQAGVRVRQPDAAVEEPLHEPRRRARSASTSPRCRRRSRSRATTRRRSTGTSPRRPRRRSSAGRRPTT